jgi:hypothetical protein
VAVNLDFVTTEAYGPRREQPVTESAACGTVNAGQRCGGSLLAIVPETFRAFTSFLK